MKHDLKVFYKKIGLEDPEVFRGRMMSENIIKWFTEKNHPSVYSKEDFLVNVNRRTGRSTLAVIRTLELLLNDERDIEFTLLVEGIANQNQVEYYKHMVQHCLIGYFEGAHIIFSGHAGSGYYKFQFEVPSFAIRERSFFIGDRASKPFFRSFSSHPFPHRVNISSDFLRDPVEDEFDNLTPEAQEHIIFNMDEFI